MMRSLFSGVSGLRNHQFRMDVIGNNVANVNTVAFKSGRVAFKEGFAQLLSGATRPPGDQGGTNPIQIGLGSAIGSVDTLFSQGNLETTGLNTDVAIQGDAFFVTRKGAQQYYTRSGNFQLDAQGRLVSPTNGFVVQGRMAVNGTLQEGITDIELPFGQKVSANATTTTRMTGNLDSSAPIFSGAFDATNRALSVNSRSYQSVSIGTYDDLGNKVELKIWAWKTGQNQWDWEVDAASLPPGVSLSSVTPSTTNTARGRFTFDPASGLLDTSVVTADDTAGTPTYVNAGPMPGITLSHPGGVSQTISLDLGAGPAGGAVQGTLGGITQFAGESNAVLRDQDGYQSGTLQDFTIDRTGVITGSFTNGTTLTLGQIVLADFNNPSGLLRVGDNMFSVSGNSGGAVLGFALSGSQSMITAGALEMSNVDLAQEFTNMIVAQRGFQANSRVITSSDDMLNDVVSLKR
ncbi:MAG: flagellar hook protein FlgE [Gemmatimonadaceae bacterium]|nr:flagellar hook protein FlgE [Gemmatimonadaceae bacterium]